MFSSIILQSDNRQILTGLPILSANLLGAIFESTDVHVYGGLNDDGFFPPRVRSVNHAKIFHLPLNEEEIFNSFP